MPAELLTARHRVQVELGRGGMGVVCLGQDLLLDPPVAVKLLTHQAVSGQGQDRLPRAAMATAQFNHSTIESVFDAGSLPAWAPSWGSS